MVVKPERGVAIDIELAERARLERLGHTRAAARRIAAAHLPESVAEGLGSPFYRESLETAAAADPPEHAVVALDEARWLVPVDPPRFRDFMSFEQHHLSARSVLERPVPEVAYTLPPTTRRATFRSLPTRRLSRGPGIATGWTTSSSSGSSSDAAAWTSLPMKRPSACSGCACSTISPPATGSSWKPPGTSDPQRARTSAPRWGRGS